MFVSGTPSRAVAGNLLLALLLGASGAPLAASGQGRPGKKAQPRAAASAGIEDPDIRAQMLALLAGLKGFEAKEACAPGLDLRVGPTGFEAKEASAPGLEGLWTDARLHPEADLRRAFLGGADLKQCNLERADLRGADLSGAALAGAVLTGARMEGTRLFQAQILGAVGLDLTGAELHPFFEIDAYEEIGDLKFLDCTWSGWESRGFPRHLVCVKDILFWVEGSQPLIHSMAVTGARYSLSPTDDRKTVALLKDSNQVLWCFGDKTLRLFNLDRITGAGSLVDCQQMELPFEDSPLHLAAGLKGEIWLSFPERPLEFSAADGGFTEVPHDYASPRISAESQALPSRDGRWIYLAAPDRDHIVGCSTETGKLAMAPLSRGSRPRRIAAGKGNGMWFTVSGAGWIGEVDLTTGSGREHPLELKAGAAVDLQGLALGPDGCMWVADRAGDQIARISETGTIRWFPLPPGTRPLELVSSDDGRILFTMEARNGIGSIRAELRPATRVARGRDRFGDESIQETKADPGRTRPVPPGPVAEPAVPAPSAAASAEPAPSPEKRITDRERREAHWRRVLRAEQRFLERTQAPAPAAEAMEAPAPPAEAKEAPGPTPIERLDALDVLLTPCETRHILRQHGAGCAAGQSPFAPEFHTAGALEALIAAGMENADAIARIRKPRHGAGLEPSAGRSRLRVVDPLGRYLTYCRMDRPVGHCGGAATRLFVVVTNRVEDEDGRRLHDVVTAHPVPDGYLW